MSETQTVNPYATDTMPEGGGLTRDNIVTTARYIAKSFTKRDGSQGDFVGLVVTALRANVEGKTDTYELSAGSKCKPSPDGEMLLDEKGQPFRFTKNSNLGKFVAGLEKGGYDPRLLYPRISALVGARIVFGATQKLDVNGKPKTHTYQGKVYEDFNWFPVEYKGGAGTRVAGGNGAGKSAADIEVKTEAAVVAALVEAGGSAERKDIIRALGTNLKGDVDAVKVTTTFARADFHQGRPWTVEGSTLTLAQ